MDFGSVYEVNGICDNLFLVICWLDFIIIF